MSVRADLNMVMVGSGGEVPLTFQSGLQRTGNTVRLGAPNTTDVPLDWDSYINTGGFTLYVRGTGANNTAIKGMKTTGGAGVYGESQSGTGTYGVSTSGIGVAATSTSNYGLMAQSSSNGLPGVYVTKKTTSNAAVNLALELNTDVTSLNAANGIGTYMQFTASTTIFTSHVMNSLKSYWTDVTHLTRTSEFALSGVNAGTTADLLVIAGSGRTRLNKYGVGSFTAGTAVYSLLVDASGFIMEGTLPGAGASITADNGLTMTTSTNVQLGGTLLHDTTVDCTALYTMFFTGARTGSSSTVSVTNTSSGHALIGTATGAGYGIFGSGFRGVFGTTSSGYGVRGNATSGIALYSETASGISLSVNHNPAAFNDVQNAIHINRFTTGNSGFGASGIGSGILFSAPTTTSTAAVAGGQINWNWTDATHASRSGEFNLLLEHNATGLANVLEIRSTGLFILTKGLSNYADDTAAAAGGIPVNGWYRNGSIVMIRVT